MSTVRDEPDWIRIGFYVAAAFNIVGILFVSRGFSNTALGEADPLFTAAGCQLIALWGAAYLSVAHHFHQAPYISLVFAFEKGFYVHAWIDGLLNNGDAVSLMREVDRGNAMFLTTYGAGDAAFMAFFFYVWWRYRSAESASESS